MEKGLVNLITPAYNSASFVFRLLDSVLSQTYPKIKMYVIDDGSTDNTREVIEGYMPLFEKRGYELVYKYQENSGLSAAINNGLKLVDGEFLLWPDSDDWYKEPYSIEKLVSALQDSYDEVGVARCRREFVDEVTFQVIRTSSFPNYGFPENILEDAVYEQNGFEWSPGCHVIKTKFLDRFIPNRNIYTEKEAGQDYQLLLPFYANSKCVSIEDVLLCYLVRADSHCRAKGFEKEKNRVEAYVRTWASVFETNSMEIKKSKIEEYKKQGFCRYYVRLLKNDVEYLETNSFQRHINECNDLNVPLPKRYKKMGIWTKFFSLKSYCAISNIRLRVRNAVCKKDN
ncbi:MAG: glycosyltransferase family 2 protein [Bacteroidales bacterium]|nr:glycosyltransferase family 2 protein [Bacteroidales bacterium]